MPSQTPSDLTPNIQLENDNKVTQASLASSKSGPKSWLIFASMCICLFLSALELSFVSTALPTIANDLRATRFTWVGSAYALAFTAFLPICSGLVHTLGKRPSILVAIGLFALGSGICGGSNSMNMLIAGRAIQGFGGGGIQSLTGIILVDLVTPQEYGIHAGFYGITWCLAVSIGPVVGGSLASQGQWRWLFYLNLPISLAACVSVMFLPDMHIPLGGYREKIMRMDWIGSFLVLSSTAACTIGLTWGGITAPWDSAMVLVPLVLGFVGLGAFIVYEAIVKYPLVPLSLMTNITCVSGYMQTFCSTLTTFAIVYYLPVYFQACKGASAFESGIYSLVFASLALVAVVTGLSVKLSNRYRPQMWIGWIFTIIALCLMSTILATDPLLKSFLYIGLLAWGIGMLTATPIYPIQAPLPATQNAPALTFMWFLCSLASVWGITIGSAVLQNELAKKLPVSLIRFFPQGTAITYALIPELSKLPSQIQLEARVAFAGSLAVLWRVLAVICSAGLAASLFMKGLSLHTMPDDWVLKTKEDMNSCPPTNGLHPTSEERVKVSVI